MKNKLKPMKKIQELKMKLKSIQTSKTISQQVFMRKLKLKRALQLIRFDCMSHFNCAT